MYFLKKEEKKKMDFRATKRIFFYCIAAVLLLQLSFFMLSRLTLFVKEFNHLSKQRQHDEYIVQSICSLSNVRMRMGDHVTVCLDAEQRLRHSPLAEATQRVIDSTHICGSTACLDILSDVAAIVSDFWILSLAPLMWYVGSFLVAKLQNSTKAILKQEVDLPQTLSSGAALAPMSDCSYAHIKFD